MKKQFVLRKNHQFQQVINNKKQLVSKSIVIYYKKNNLDHVRIGISISKKFANAVKRNRYRRQVRHILRKLKLENSFQVDIVLIIRKPFLTMNSNFQTRAIQNIFERLSNEQ